jgi:threonine/homoserine/homoserine lactone efflux protein
MPHPHLIYLGVRKLMAKPSQVEADQPKETSLKRIFSQGLLVAVLNPKTVLFFLAFLPQFIDKSQGAIPQQILLLGVIFVTMGWFSNAGYALLTGAAGSWLRSSRIFVQVQRYVTGTMYIGLGLTAAFVGNSTRK